MHDDRPRRGTRKKNRRQLLQATLPTSKARVTTRSANVSSSFPSVFSSPVHERLGARSYIVVFVRRLFTGSRSDSPNKESTEPFRPSLSMQTRWGSNEKRSKANKQAPADAVQIDKAIYRRITTRHVFLTNAPLLGNAATPSTTPASKYTIKLVSLLSGRSSHFNELHFAFDIYLSQYAGRILQLISTPSMDK